MFKASGLCLHVSRFTSPGLPFNRVYFLFLGIHAIADDAAAPLMLCFKDEIVLTLD